VNAASSPRDLVAAIEASPTLPGGGEERFAGYGVMGLPFRSGHILALRCFPASSVGPPYRAVWHRDPEGRWTFFQDVPLMQGCARYFGAALAEVAGEHSIRLKIAEYEVTAAAPEPRAGPGGARRRVPRGRLRMATELLPELD